MRADVGAKNTEMTKNPKTKRYLLLNLFIPVATCCLVPDGRYGLLTVLVWFGLPIALLVFDLFLIPKTTFRVLFLCILLATVGVLLGQQTGYIIWGVSSDRLFTPDGETVWIQEALLKYNLATMSAGGLALLLIKAIHQRKEKAPTTAFTVREARSGKENRDKLRGGHRAG